MTNATSLALETAAPNAYVETCTEYLAIIYINGGSAWASEPTAFEAIRECKRRCEEDWGSLYRLDGRATIHVHDYSKAAGWIADHRGLRDRDTGEPLPFLFTVTCKLENTREQKRRNKAAAARRAVRS